MYRGEHEDFTIRNQNFEIEDINEKEAKEAYNKDTFQRIKSASHSVSSLSQHISNIHNLKIKNDYTVLFPFYSEEYNNRLGNAYNFDDVINSAIERLAYFTLGTSDEIRSVLYPESLRPINSELEAKNEIKLLDVVKTGLDVAGSVVNNHLSDQEIAKFETFIHYSDKNAKLGRFLKKNFRASHVFGRSASYIEHTDHEIRELNLPVGTPVGLKPLKPMMLGNVAIDPNSWEVLAVEYKDPKVSFKEYRDAGVRQQQAAASQTDPNLKSKYLAADNLLYFVRNNNNMMRDEDDFFFGHSTIQSILPLSEESRRLKQIVFPQLNQSHWAGSMIWFFPNWSEERMDRVFRSVKPGGHIGIPDPNIKIQEMQLKHDYTGLINLQNELKKGMLTAFGLPSFLMNFEDVTNRATAETVVIGFNESTIQSERSWITDILDEQWYSKLFKIYFPFDDYIHIKMKMVTEFENITFENFLEKAVAAVSLYEKKMMTLSEVRNMLKLPPLQPSDYAELGIQFVDPATQAAPGTPNLVQSLVAQKQQQVQQENGQQKPTGLGAGNTLATAQSDLLAE